MDQYVIIIGAMKSGTTTLFQKMARHSKIAPAYPKEPGFFAFDDTYAQGFDWYHSLFDFDPTQHSYRLEASTDYTKAPFATGAWERMAACKNARFKLIYIMRHPLRRLESHARHVQKTGKEIGQIVSDRTGHGLENGLSLASLAMSNYAQQLDAYRDPWAGGDLLPVTLEELKTDPGAVMDRVWAFLGLSPEQEPEEDTSVVFNSGQRQLTQPTALGKLAQHPAVLAAGKALIGKGARERIKQHLIRPVRIEGRFQLTGQEEDILNTMLAPDLVRLQEEYGVPVTQLWGLPKV